MEELFTEYGIVASACLGFLGMLLYFHYGDPRRSELRLRCRRGKAMEDARRAYLYQHLADLVTDGLEDSVYTKKISRQESATLYNLLGKKLGIRDFFPIYKNREMLKQDIKRRLTDNTYFFASPNGIDVRRACKIPGFGITDPWRTYQAS